MKSRGRLPVIESSIVSSSLTRASNNLSLRFTRDFELVKRLGSLARGKAGPILVVLVMCIAAAQIISTYVILGQTWDEPFHIAAGMEWLQFKKYRVENLHPPLARVAVALGPFLAGRRLTGTGLSWEKAWREGNNLLDGHRSYFHNLTLARLGVLPFFLLATALVWLWSERLFGEPTGVLSALLFANLPPVLAHSGLATTDMASAALCAGALFSLTLWLDKPDFPRSLLLGAAVAAAVLAKFSALIFLPACIIPILLVRFLTNRMAGVKLFGWGKGACVAAVTAVLLIWAGYRFSTTALASPEARPHKRIDRIVGAQGPFHDVAYRLVEAPLFLMPEFASGLWSLIEKNRGGEGSFFMGQRRTAGVWYYFPAVLAIKTPIPFILFAVIGSSGLFSKLKKVPDWRPAVPLISALVILVVCLASNINLGVRHILAIYPMISIVAGFGAATVWQSRAIGFGMPLLAVVFLSWQMGSAIRTGPDYLAYFNSLAGANPANILVDSDLDWGQDLPRLRDALEAWHVKKLSIAYFGTADLARFHLPELQSLVPHQCTMGWVAISLTTLKTGTYGRPGAPGFMMSGNNGFRWLENYQPVALIGSSIRLYFIPERSCSSQTPLKRRTTVDP
jgi:hypothetical protein